MRMPYRSIKRPNFGPFAIIDALNKYIPEVSTITPRINSKTPSHELIISGAAVVMDS
jgi:hypothetical protein